MILSAVGKRIGLGNSHLALNDAVPIGRYGKARQGACAFRVDY
jgi:hypothetical protein